MGANAQARKGMICVVPHGTADAELAELGRHLRRKYDPYPAITIQVFDDMIAARAYHEDNAPAGEHRVMMVARDAQRDGIRIFRNGVEHAVPLPNN